MAIRVEELQTEIPCTGEVASNDGLFLGEA